MLFFSDQIPCSQEKARVSKKILLLSTLFLYRPWAFRLKEIQKTLLLDNNYIEVIRQLIEYTKLLNYFFHFKSTVTNDFGRRQNDILYLSWSSISNYGPLFTYNKTLLRTDMDIWIMHMMEITNENDYYYPYRICTTYYYEFHPYNLYLINYTYHKWLGKIISWCSQGKC